MSRPILPLREYHLQYNKIFTYFIFLPYNGKQDESTIRSFKNTIKKVFSENVKPKYVYAVTKLPSKFQIKYRTKERHMHDLVTHAKCPDYVKWPECNEGFISETGRRLQDRVDEHAGKY